MIRCARVSRWASETGRCCKAANALGFAVYGGCIRGLPAWARCSRGSTRGFRSWHSWRTARVGVYQLLEGRTAAALAWVPCSDGRSHMALGPKVADNGRTLG